MVQPTFESSNLQHAKGFGLVTAAFLALLFPTGAYAQSREDAAPADAMAVGEHNRATPWGTSALYYNPAGIIRVPLLMVQAGYNYLAGREGHNFNGAIIDSRTNAYAALGVAYSYFATQPEGRDRDGHQMRLALATQYVSDQLKLSAGLGARYLSLTYGEFEDQAEEELNAWTMDIGLILDFGGRIRFGVAGQNLIDTKSTEAPRVLGLGLGFIFELLEVNASIDLDLREDVDLVRTWGIGADLQLAGILQLRAGFTRDEPLDQERVSFGLGWSNSSVALDLGYSLALSKPSRDTFGVSVRWLP